MTPCYIGEIRPFAGTFAPYGWNLCDGSLLSISAYQALYSLIGTTYGGDGQTTFGVPDLRGRAAINQGQGPGLGNYILGQPLGVETVTVTTAQLPAHPHTFSGNTGAGGTATPGTTAVLSSSPSGEPIYDGTATPVALSPQSTTTVGGSQPHNNRQPYVAITYIIALEGIYPTQN